MSQDKMDFTTNWYEQWMKQSQEFFSTAEKNLKDGLGNQAFTNPQQHMQQISAWLDNMKKQWEYAQLTNEQKAYKLYWDMMAKMYNDASELMLSQWIKRTEDKKPIQNIHDLYELWLNSCHETYQKMLKTKNYQDAYGDFMNATFKYWKDMTSK